MSIKFRKLVSGDSYQYRKIRLESLKIHPESFGATYEEERLIPKLRFEKAIEEPFDERFIFGAFDQKELIGILGFVPFILDDVLDLPHTGTLIQMYARSAYSGRKIGLNLSNAVVREAFNSSDIDQVVLGVRKDNMRAIHVYEQAGFQNYHSERVRQKIGHDGFQIMIIHRAL